ncbi:pentapeptide repeat-containing protein [Reyranella sp.]|uniref:pentapeptide repeat-containing protein n=1 Tax=Reyranella sp. TaxID=1929291 RepID=UPI003BA974D0
MANQNDLQVAANGKDHWNTWVNAHPGYNADFSGHVFTSMADFAGFNFPGKANFQNCTFTADVTFKEARIWGEADFSGATFQAYAALDRIQFRDDANFQRAHFKQYLYLVHSEFYRWATFREAMFNGTLELTGSTFHGETDFTQATFDDAIFKAVQFKSALTTFALTIFKKVPDFRNCRFDTPPILYGMDVGDDPTSKQAADAQDADKFRRLKVLASDAKDFQSELNFFADELRAKRGHETKKRSAILLNKTYECVSNFGQSIARPFWWLLGMIAVSGFIRVGACLPSSISSVDAAVSHFMMSLADTALLVGSEKWELRAAALKLAVCNRHFGLLEHVGALLQSLTGLILLFLIVLGLRNRFRIGGGN